MDEGLVRHPKSGWALSPKGYAAMSGTPRGPVSRVSRPPSVRAQVRRYLQLCPQPLVLRVQLGLAAAHGQQFLVLADPEDLVLLLQPLVLGHRVLQLWHR